MWGFVEWKNMRFSGLLFPLAEDLYPNHFAVLNIWAKEDRGMIPSPLIGISTMIVERDNECARGEWFLRFRA
jgi:hypothetical protein